MRTGDWCDAVRIYEDLERLEPGDPTWPRRRADAHAALGETEAQLASLRRALALLVDAGQVLAAIATCKGILDVRPDDTDALECLHLLYSETGGAGGGDAAPARGAGPAPRLPASEHAPLEELELTEVIPEARAPDAGDPDALGVSEIPLGESRYPHVREELARTPLFGSLDAATLHRVLPHVRVLTLPAGDVLFREGDPADTLFVVVEGAVVPIAEGPPRTRMAVLEEGAFFGEIGLVTNRPRTATIEALVDTRLLAVDRRVMWSLIRGRPDVSRILLRFLRERLVDRTMRTHPFFAAFSAGDLRAAARHFRFLEVRSGAAVLEQGRPSRGLCVLLAGSMDVIDTARDKVVDRLEAGDLFGGLAVVRGEPAPASVHSVGKCWVLVLEEARLRRMLAGRPHVEEAILACAPGGGGRPAL